MIFPRQQPKALTYGFYPTGLCRFALGASIGGSILGVSAATIGGAVGQIAGSMVDNWIVSYLSPAQRIEGAIIPRVYGRMRMGGNIIWVTDLSFNVCWQSLMSPPLPMG